MANSGAKFINIDHKFIITDSMYYDARCSCGNWHFESQPIQLNLDQAKIAHLYHLVEELQNQLKELSDKLL